MTPSIPSDIRGIGVKGYVSVYELLPEEQRLFGTESMFGDWHSPLLLLAQDFAPAQFVRDRIAQRHPDPYSHDPKITTNRNLEDMSSSAVQLGALYGSALGPLLKDTAGFGSALPNAGAALAATERVLQFTIESMPNLRAIVCMGSVAYKAVQRAFLTNTRHPTTFTPGHPPIELPNLNALVFTTAHPSTRGLTARGGKAAARSDWKEIAHHTLCAQG